MDSECASQNCLLQKFEQKDFDESPDFISREIKALDNILNRKLIAIATKAGVDQVTVMHGWIIKYLYINRENDIFQKDIEAEFAIARSTVTSILKLMEKKNYIRRISVESDARLKKIILTDKGVSVCHIIDKSIADNNRRLNSLLTEEEQKTFVYLIKKLRKGIENL